MYEIPATQYARAKRSDTKTIDRQRKVLAQSYGPVKQLYGAVSEIILIVNEDRQIVFFNSAVPSLLGVDNPGDLYGLRPGEALGCANASKSPCGCGTSEFCSQCGAVNAILAALSNKADLKECRLQRKDSLEALDLLVRTTPLQIKGERFTIVAITEISHEKRRRALERIFFHDIMNTAASLNMFAKMLVADPNGQDAPDLRQNLLTGLEQLADELYSQKLLLAAENNELVVKMQQVDGYLILADLVTAFSKRFSGHKIIAEPPNGKLVLNTDPGLLKRVLGNMILNAIEASKPEEGVRVSCGVKDGYAEFRVHNNGHIPRKDQLQLFQRSFSTKGAGRGLGTYSMKLLSERYLDGSIHLESSSQHGTMFVARYPL